MKISIFGAGYVGLVTAACLAELGNQVVCVDSNLEKIAQLRQNLCPVHEPGLPEMLEKNVATDRLKFTDSAAEAISHGFYLFITVGTPQSLDGSADLTYVMDVAKSIGQYLKEECLVIIKSTVPVGTAEKVRAVIQKELNSRRQPTQFAIASNPEFLRQGAAIADFMNSDRIIIGTENEASAEHLRILYAPFLYAPFDRNHQRLICMDIRSSELAKYAANAFLATKISFINEISHFAEKYGADIEQVRMAIGSDPRIGFHFINPGCGFGGSCFPKDVSALESMARESGYEAHLIKAVSKVNQTQKLVLFKKILHYFHNDLTDKTIALWGLSFKPNTNDMREAPSRVLMESLWQAGARVKAYDPAAMNECLQIYGEREDLELCHSPEEALVGADALAIVTEWQNFHNPDFALIKQRLRYPVIFDGRNLYDPAYLADLGIEYYAIGRGMVPLTHREPLVF